MTSGLPPLSILNTLQATVEECEDVRDRFLLFLNEFTLDEGGLDGPTQSQASQGSVGGAQTRPYVDQLHAMQEHDLSTLSVDLQHVDSWDPSLCENLLEAQYRLEPFLRQALAAFAEQHLGEAARRQEGEPPREHWLAFCNLGHDERLRDLRAARIGKLSQWVGTVTRSSEVRPELFLGAFECGLCRTIARDVPQQFKYTQPAACPNAACPNRVAWTLLPDESTFVDWQKVKVQESPDEVPAGSLPRSMDVVLRADAVETVRPGDRATFCGQLVVVPDVAALTAPGERPTAKPVGDRSAGGGGGGGDGGGVTGLTRGPTRTGVRELTYRLAFLASSARPRDARAGLVEARGDGEERVEDALAGMSVEQAAGVEAARRDPDLYERLADSIAPGVWGARDVKRAVLLQLLGGVPKTTRDGMRLRGDINVAVVGDPACAKSQILRWVAGFLPRSVYTSGKSSSAAGLTAAVVRDSETGEFCVEAGAMMLADRGVACIDEFDKMDARDAVAIHEAMEQQTISLSKAGIQATLNARAAVLAAANPSGGRYDRSRPLRHNVALAPAILSRFDLLHVLLDEADEEADRAIAKHILDVHRGIGRAKNPPYSADALRCYVRAARAVRPRIGPRAGEALVAAYRRLRAEDAAPGSGSAYRITVRQLEALVRLSEALARLRMRPEVAVIDVREAHRLIKNSIVAVVQPDATLRDNDWAAEFGEDGEEEARLAEEKARDELARSADHALEDVGLPEPARQADGTDLAAGGTERRAGEAEGPAPPASAPSRPSTTTVPRAKFDNVKNLLLLRLRRAEAEGDQDGGEAAEAGQSNAAGAAAEATSGGLPQKELLKWYFEYLVEKDAVPDAEAGARELALAERVLAHLVRREQCIVVLDEPSRADGETERQHLRRARHERILAVHPNYAQE